MHYCLMLFTKEFPTKEKIEDMMKKYHDDAFDYEDGAVEYPQFTYDWYEIGGRYNGSLKLKIEKENRMYRWGFLEQRN